MRKSLEIISLRKEFGEKDQSCFPVAQSMLSTVGARPFSGYERGSCQLQ
jgi:hypothetical protein